MSDIPVQIILEMVNRMTQPARDAVKGLEGITRGLDKIAEEGKKAAASLDRVAEANVKIKNGLGSVIGGFTRLGVKITAITALTKGMWLAVAGPALNVGRQMDDWEAKFYRIMKNRQRSKSAVRSMFALDEASVDHSWTDFAQAFTTLGTRGIIPSREDLMIMSDAAGMLGMSLDSLAMSMSKATLGSKGIYKQLGMTAELVKGKKGEKSKLNLAWAGPDGKAVRRTVSPGDTEAIINVLLERMKSGYGGYQAGNSNTFEGKRDSANDFIQTLLMWVANGSSDAPAGPWQPGKEPKQKGIFPWIKQQVTELTDWLDTMKKDGSLAKWADYTSEQIIKVMESIKSVVVGFPAFVKSIGDAVPILKKLDASGIMKLGVALWLLPDMVSIGGGLIGMASGLATLSSVLAGGAAAGGVAAGGGWGALFTVAAGITAIGAGLAVLDTYRDTMRNFWDSLTPKGSGNIIDPKSSNIAADYGAMGGQVVRKYLQKLFPGYYKTVDELQGIAPNPAPGQMGPLQPDPSKTLSGRLRKAWDWAKTPWSQQGNLSIFGGGGIQQTAEEGKQAIEALRRATGEADQVWGSAFTEKKDAKIESNIDSTYRALQNLNSLWNAPWSAKQLHLQTPAAPVAPAAATPGHASYTPRLGPSAPAAAPQKQASVNSNVQVTINAPGNDQAAFNRHAQKVASAVKAALRGAMNDGSVPQSV